AAAHAVLHPPLLGGRVLYAHYRAVTGRPLGLSPLADQHFSAWLMTVEQAFALGACLVFLLRLDRSPRLSTGRGRASTVGRWPDARSTSWCASAPRRRASRERQSHVSSTMTAETEPQVLLYEPKRLA